MDVRSAKVLQESPRVVISVGKKKTAVARAVIRPGIGRVRVNGYPLESWPIEMARVKMQEPLMLAGDLAKKVDIDVNVSGGGFMGQAVAVRIAIARGLVAYFQSQELKELYEKYDPYMLKGDPRRTEPKKPGIKHARSKRQKAYR
ncbi:MULTISPECIES: 30S ribosomal protein S9 [Pyrobaculum]|uniref:Small ribosomal subunit protein uS9 n=4 Tax=Pyrobaculum TaxID=2276 RepID=A4WNA7_PYRAR|nr:30S ribosomal protein S9 [Pyrobaculum arsenaticum]ABP51874.1 SSU ribosomal protein S9P [Pyrobaculum arsenaticum DSM 13514]MCY0891432.1 30S ribosomal protein S9 [Pyrobaculum arsenaticum]NYR16194.1 30S ribosomal protein S9 [Pyrobaculum arsenaticum]